MKDRGARFFYSDDLVVYVIFRYRFHVSYLHLHHMGNCVSQHTPSIFCSASVLKSSHEDRNVIPRPIPSVSLLLSLDTRLSTSAGVQPRNYIE